MLKSLETDSEEEDVLCDLPQKASKVSRQRHIVLLVDASGSMRTEDVELDARMRQERDDVRLFQDYLFGIYFGDHDFAPSFCMMIKQY